MNISQAVATRIRELLKEKDPISIRTKCGALTRYRKKHYERKSKGRKFENIGGDFRWIRDDGKRILKFRFVFIR